jgi:hypothetical protein
MGCLIETKALRESWGPFHVESDGALASYLKRTQESLAVES